MTQFIRDLTWKEAKVVLIATDGSNKWGGSIWRAAYKAWDENSMDIHSIQLLCRGLLEEKLKFNPDYPNTKKQVNFGWSDPVSTTRLGISQCTGFVWATKSTSKPKESLLNEQLNLF